MSNSKSYGFDPRTCHSLSEFQWGVHLHQGTLTVPKNPSSVELEWEYYVSKLHWGYAHASENDLETIKKIAEKL